MFIKYNCGCISLRLSQDGSNEDLEYVMQYCGRDQYDTDISVQEKTGDNYQDLDDREFEIMSVEDVRTLMDSIGDKIYKGYDLEQITSTLRRHFK